MLTSALAAARRHRILTAALVTGVVLAGLEVPYLMIARSGGTLRTLSAQSAPRRENRPAPSFVVPTLEGAGTIGVGHADGRVTVLNFWASWCTASRAEAPVLEAVWNELRPAVRFLGVDEGDRRTDARSFERELGVSYASGFDPNERIASHYGVFGLPYTFVIDRTGRIRLEFRGRVDPSSLRSVLRALVRT